jgi:hypothetical protein
VSFEECFLSPLVNIPPESITRQCFFSAEFKPILINIFIKIFLTMKPQNIRIDFLLFGEGIVTDGDS